MPLARVNGIALYYEANAATVWHAYRANGFADTLQGFGSLLR